MPIITGGRVIETSRPHWRNNATVGVGPFSSPALPAAGYLNGVAQPGATVIRTDTGAAYANTGTLAATVWTLLGNVV